MTESATTCLPLVASSPVQETPEVPEKERRVGKKKMRNKTVDGGHKGKEDEEDPRRRRVMTALLESRKAEGQSGSRRKTKKKFNKREMVLNYTEHEYYLRLHLDKDLARPRSIPQLMEQTRVATVRGLLSLKAQARLLEDEFFLREKKKERRLAMALQAIRPLPSSSVASQSQRRKESEGASASSLSRSMATSPQRMTASEKKKNQDADDGERGADEEKWAQECGGFAEGAHENSEEVSALNKEIHDEDEKETIQEIIPADNKINSLIVSPSSSPLQSKASQVKSTRLELRQMLVEERRRQTEELITALWAFTLTSTYAHLIHKRGVNITEMKRIALIKEKARQRAAALLQDWWRLKRITLAITRNPSLNSPQSALRCFVLRTWRQYTVRSRTRAADVIRNCLGSRSSVFALNLRRYRQKIIRVARLLILHTILKKGSSYVVF